MSNLQKYSFLFVSLEYLLEKMDALPDIDLAPEKKCLEDDRFLLGQKAYFFRGRLLSVPGRVFLFQL